MRIRCWGVRGSIPVSGSEYVVYGGDTTCFEVETKNGDVILIDAGTGIRPLGNRFVAEGRKHATILFTHSHWDHLLGFPFFKPLYLPETRIDVYGCRFAQQSVKHILTKTMSPPFFPVRLEDLKAELCYRGACREPFAVGGLSITPVFLNHPGRGVGFKLVEKGRSFVFLTDNELGFPHPGGLANGEYVAFCRGCDVLFHDAEFTEAEYGRTRGWGHSSVDDALSLALDAGVKRFGLIHHNADRTDAALDDIVGSCRSRLRDRGSDLECFGVRTGMELFV